ncbi:MAG: DUF5610 domain-containing protein [Deltaproteobacteria bacterium]|nr:DUF5610 domain-containing protein [Deltaproteobacteria bacterium]MBN2671160.1 DUF5610 domain-containing protein [Deltaproteobacteria bacterium]
MHVEFNVKKSYGQNARLQQRRLEKSENIFSKDSKDKVELSADASRQTASMGTIDKIDLSAGMSIDDVNRLLETAVGEKVKAMFEDAGIEPSTVANTDWSPEATAERIFRGTTGLFEIWKSQNKDMSEEELIDSFEQVLRNAVDRGASEAIGMIEARGFNEEESVVSTARETISMVHEKFDNFFESMRNDLGEKSESTARQPD